MKIFVKVKSRARKSVVEKIDDAHFLIRVNAPPVDGKANEAVIAALAVYFDIPKSRVELKSGGSSTQKIFVI